MITIPGALRSHFGSKHIWPKFHVAARFAGLRWIPRWLRSKRCERGCAAAAWILCPSLGCLRHGLSAPRPDRDHQHCLLRFALRRGAGLRIRAGPKVGGAGRRCGSHRPRRGGGRAVDGSGGLRCTSQAAWVSGQARMPIEDFRVPATWEEELDELAAAIAASLVLDTPPTATSSTQTGAAPSGDAVPEDTAGPDVSAGSSSCRAGEPAPEPSVAAEREPEPPAVATEGPPTPRSFRTAAAPAAWLPLDIGRQSLDISRGIRVYSVWRLSAAGGGTQWAGIHAGLQTDAYYGLLALNQGNFGGIAFQRCADVDAAERIWLRERHRWNFSGPPRLFWWDPRPHP